MTKNFKLSVMGILGVTLALTLKDCNRKLKSENLNALYMADKARERIVNDSFFKVNGEFFKKLNLNINICYSNLENIPISVYGSESDVLPDLIAFKMSEYQDSLKQKTEVWPYTTANTLALRFNPSDVSEFSMEKKLRNLNSVSDNSNSNPEDIDQAYKLFPDQKQGYFGLSEWLKKIKYLAFIVQDKKLEPELGSQSFKSGAMHYKIALFDLSTHKLLDKKEVVAINSDIQVHNEYELYIDLFQNSNKALMKTLFRL